MGIYLGTLGRMIKVPYIGSQQVQSEERYSFATTLEGARKAQLRPKGPRTWALSADHFRPNEHSILSQFAEGDWGSGPFIFMSTDALVSNMLTPGVASLIPGEVGATQGGPVQLPDGSWAARSILGDGVGNVLFGTTRSPLPPAGQVSAGAWVQGVGASTRLNWYDASMAFIGSSVSSEVSAGGWLWSMVVASPPVNAVGVIVSADKASRATMPAFLWGPDAPSVWSDGQGCTKAVVSGFSRDQVLAVRGHTFSNVSFTVTEVG